MNGRGPWLSISCLASNRASALAACFPLAKGRGTATGQRPRRLGLSLVARLWRRERLGVRDGPTLRRRRRDVSAGAARGRLPLLPLKRPTRPLLWCPRPRGVGVGSRRALEDPVEARHHPLGVVAVDVAITTLILIW